MRIDEEYFRALLRQAIDENALCCRAVFSLCRIEFTTAVPTLCVSLGERSVLRVNLEFVAKHCETEEHVHALLIHEFLHILLGHTVRIKRMTPAVNIALDTVINSIIHRKFKAAYSSMMSRYYEPAKGPVRLLRPMTTEDHRHWKELLNTPKKSAEVQNELDHYSFHSRLELGHVTSSDVLDFLQHLEGGGLDPLSDGVPVLLGGHGEWGDPLDSLPPKVRDRVRQVFSAIDPKDIWREGNPLSQVFLPKSRPVSTIPPAWKAQTRKLLQRLLVPDPRSRTRNEESRPQKFPVLTASDRRGALRSIWNPILPDLDWESSRPVREGTVQIYLDVSGSMGNDLPWLVLLLQEFSACIRRPLWAFSSVVAPATIRNGQLITSTTGATILCCALQHAKQTGARKALVITDGYVEPPPENFSLPCPTESLIPHGGRSETLASYGIPVHTLPPTP